MYSQAHAGFESKPLLGRLSTMRPTFTRMNQYVDMSSKEGTNHETYTSVEREREEEEERMREKRFLYIYIFNYGKREKVE